MSVSNNNATRVRFDNGGRILIKNGANYLNIMNVRPGEAFEYVPGLRDILHEPDRGALTTPQNGDEKPTQLRIRVNGTAAVASTELESWFMNVENSTPDGNRLLHDIYIEIPNFLTATAGKLYRFQKCAVKPEGGVSVKAGAMFDQLDLDLLDFESKPSVTAYLSPLS